MMGSMSSKDNDIFKELMMVAALRGEDSAGVFSVPERSNEPRVLKVVGTPYDLFAHHKYNAVASAWTSRAIVGHCRKATVGSVSKYTAHPFHYDNIVGVHNGTLRNWRAALKVDGDYQVDSQKLFANVAAHGIRDTIEGLDGAYAMVWWDETEETLNFLRNSERTLYYAFNEDVTKMYWHSELWALRGILMRNGVKTHVDKEGDSFWSVPIDTHYRWGLRFEQNKTKMVMIANEKLEGNVKPQVSVPFQGMPGAYHGGRSGNPTGFQNRGQNPNPQGTTPTPAASPTTPSSIILSSNAPSAPKSSVPQPFQQGRSTLSLVRTNSDSGTESSKPSLNAKKVEEELNDPLPGELAGQLKGYHGTLLSRAGYESTCDTGCQFCSQEVTFDEALKNPPRFLDHDRILCHDCNTGVLSNYGMAN